MRGYGLFTVYDRNSFITIILAIALFELFRRIPLKNSKVVEFMGKATLMVYLLSDNAFVYSIWRHFDLISLFAKRPCKCQHENVDFFRNENVGFYRLVFCSSASSNS